MKAMVLAAGLGERMWPLTEDRAKPSLPLLNRPIIAHTLEHLVRHEWAAAADDVLWRRTKCGLAMTASERQAFAGDFTSP